MNHLYNFFKVPVVPEVNIKQFVDFTLTFDLQSRDILSSAADSKSDARLLNIVDSWKSDGSNV